MSPRPYIVPGDRTSHGGTGTGTGTEASQADFMHDEPLAST